MLNAFRHHGLFRRRPSRSTTSSGSSAQRLSASRIISVVQDISHPYKYYSAQRLSASRIISDARLRDGPTCSCAQRLSASRIISVDRAGIDCRRNQCSTPFGITDYFGRPCRCRHRLQLHRAQRLSASRIISVDVPHILTRHKSAQRLSASRIISAASPAVRTPSTGCSTPFGITDYFGWMPTSCRWPRPSAQRLSASRIISDRNPVRDTAAAAVGAQRLSASRIISAAGDLSGSRSSRECSTPFGITDYFGRAPADGLRRRDVLNAFRHHGLFRGGRRGIGPVVGISAQRLSASRIISGRHVALPAAQVVEVLNAFRHHGLFRWYRPHSPAPRSGAQRLSASRIISDPSGRWWRAV